MSQLLKDLEERIRAEAKERLIIRVIVGLVILAGGIAYLLVG